MTNMLSCFTSNQVLSNNIPTGIKCRGFFMCLCDVYPIFLSIFLFLKSLELYYIIYVKHFLFSKQLTTPGFENRLQFFSFDSSQYSGKKISLPKLKQEGKVNCLLQQRKLVGNNETETSESHGLRVREGLLFILSRNTPLVMKWSDVVTVPSNLLYGMVFNMYGI